MAKMPITSGNTICIGGNINKKVVNPCGNRIAMCNILKPSSYFNIINNRMAFFIPFCLSVQIINQKNT